MRKQSLVPWTVDSLGEKIRLNSTLQGECVVWLADTNIAGYPRLTEKRDGKQRQMTVQRVWWALHRGEISPSMFLRMRCKNRACVCLEHMYLEPRGGFSASVRTATARAAYEGKRAKLSDDGVRLVRESSLPIVFLADVLGVTPQSISFARNGRTHRSSL